MERELDAAAEQEVSEMIFEYFAEECGMDRERLNRDTNIIEDIEGDSLMLFSLLEMVLKKYGLTVELKVLGQRLMQQPSDTIGQVIDLTLTIIRHGGNIVSVAL